MTAYKPTMQPNLKPILYKDYSTPHLLYCNPKPASITTGFKQVEHATILVYFTQGILSLSFRKLVLLGGCDVHFKMNVAEIILPTWTLKYAKQFPKSILLHTFRVQSGVPSIRFQAPATALRPCQTVWGSPMSRQSVTKLGVTKLVRAEDTELLNP